IRYCPLTHRATLISDRPFSSSTVTEPPIIFFFFFHHTAPTEIYTLSLHDALPISEPRPDMPRERQWQVRAREVVLAAGALERPLVFPGNDRPGIMLAGAARTWLNRYGVLPGTRAVVVTACDEAYDAALEFQGAGVFVAAIAELRTGADGAAAAKARAGGIPVLP